MYGTRTCPAAVETRFSAPHFRHLLSIRVLPCLTVRVLRSNASFTKRSDSSRIACFDISRFLTFKANLTTYFWPAPSAECGFCLLTKFGLAQCTASPQAAHCGSGAKSQALVPRCRLVRLIGRSPGSLHLE